MFVPLKTTIFNKYMADYIKELFHVRGTHLKWGCWMIG